MMRLLSLAVLLAIVSYSIAQPATSNNPIYINPAANCSFSYNGSKYDFTSLVSSSGGISWQQSWNGTSYTIQLQVCGNIAHPSIGCPPCT